MKVLKYLLVLFLFGIIITSCQKEETQSEIPIEQTSQIESRSYNQVDCGFVENFCEKQSTYPVAVALVSNGGNDEGITISVGIEDFQVFPFETFDGGTGLIVNQGEENYIGHRIENEYLQSKSVTVDLPNQLGEIIEIDYGENFSVENVAIKINQATGKSNVGTSSHPSFVFTDVDDIIDITWIKACDYVLVSKVENFISVFFQPGDQSQIEGFVEDAFNSCPPAYPNYQGNIPNRCLNYCIDPRCVVDYLLDINAGLSDFQKRVLVSRYLQEVMGLTDEEQNWLTLSAQIDLIFDIYDGLLTNQNLGICENEDCGMIGGFHEVIKQSMAGITLTAQETTDLLEGFSGLRCDDPAVYNCIREFQQNLVSETSTALMTLSNCASSGLPPFYLSSCEEVFPFTDISDTYYAQTNFINLGFWSEFNPLNYVTFCFPSLCIQVPNQNSLGITFTEEEAAALVAEAFDQARLSVFYEVEAGNITTSAGGKIAFVNFLLDELAEAFLVQPSSVSVNQLPCNNGADAADYAVSLFGFCPTAGECVY